VNNADLIVAMLKAAGIARGFGVPSGNVLPLMEAMRVGGIDFVLTAHEGSAGFAADVTARVTGSPGLCIATLGPGATNLATGVGCAWLDRSPLIAITCTLDEAQLARRIQMRIDHQALFKAITKGTFVLSRANVRETVAKALRLATTEPVGPVHLDLPEDVALAPADEQTVRAERNDLRTVRPEPNDLRTVRPERNDLRPVRPERNDLRPVRPERNDVKSKDEQRSIDKAAALLRRARRPIAVIGASAMRMRNPDLLRVLVERHHIPFAMTTMAKGLIDDDHPLSLGCIERARRQLQRAFIREHADLIVGLGYDTIEVEYEAWAGRVPVLHVDIERANVDPSVVLVHELVGDLDSCVGALASLDACENDWNTQPGAAEQGATRRGLLEEHRSAFHRALRPPSEGFSPHDAIDVVRRVLPPDGILAFDVGAHTHQIASQWTAHAPRTFLITNGWSSMGFGIPAAIAAKLARPDLPVVCIVGDGCFQMTCGEVAVAKRETLAIAFVVLDDRWLSLIKVKQERRDLEHYGTALLDTGYDAPPAHYFGVPAVGVRTAADLERALAEALRSDGPTVIEALVDPTPYSQTVYD
jgi:acetolactate synthase-1/2/3 large subunit